jgi:hypothetical protein
LFIEFPTMPQTSDQSRRVNAIKENRKSGSDLRDFIHIGGTLKTSKQFFVAQVQKARLSGGSWSCLL